MKEYITVSVESLELIKQWLEQREPVNGILALEAILTLTPRVSLEETSTLIDQKVKFLVG